MKKILLTSLIFIYSFNIYAQVIPLKAQTGIYEMKGDYYKLLYTDDLDALEYKNLVLENEKGIPDFRESAILVTLEEKVFIDIRITVLSNRIQILAVDGKNVLLLDTCISIEKFVATGNSNNKMYGSISDTSQMSILWPSDSGILIIVDLPLQIKGKQRVLHLKPKFI